MKRVLIVGGSTRGAAWSARRAGLQPICADLFADLDTRQIAEIVPVRDYPTTLPEDVRRVQADGWFYTGALENHPDLIQQLDQSVDTHGPLLGCSAAALRQIRDPFWLANLLRQAQIPPLDLLPMSANPPRDGSWMRKPLASAGGRAVAIWDESSSIDDSSEPYFFQARIGGDIHSAIYRCQSSVVEFLGLTRQLSDITTANAPSPFHYCGSIGPLPESEAERYRLQLDRIADHLTEQTHLRGIFGIDFIPDSGGQVRVLEVNPRYTASVEIIELAQQCPLLFDLSNARIQPRKTIPCVAKAILYASTPLVAPLLDQYSSNQSDWEIPAVADVPVPGSVIDTGWPICSVMAHGDTSQRCLESLSENADRVWRQLANCGKP